MVNCILKPTLVRGIFETIFSIQRTSLTGCFKFFTPLNVRYFKMDVPVDDSNSNDYDVGGHAASGSDNKSNATGQKYPNFVAYAVKFEDIEDAAERIKPYIKHTPVMTSTFFNKITNKQIFFKCENLQKVGAFKYRGVSNAVIQLKHEMGLDCIKFVTHSSGNHAQALALAANVHNSEAHIVMPSNAPIIKKNAVKGYGGNVYECYPSQEARESMANDVLQRLAPVSIMISPYDHPYIIAGAGTMALEVYNDCPNVDAFVVPVGGGGMLSGICIAAKGLNPNVKIFAAEPLKANDCALSFSAKKKIPNAKYPDTIADGLRVNVGDITWPIIRDHISDVITVSDEEIIEATRLVFERMKLVIEPSAGVGVAACLTKKFKELSSGLDNIAVILCGGNIDLQKLPWL